LSNWRLLKSLPLSASANMALDEALFNVSSQPILRFYSWKSPSVSVGYFQRLDEDFLRTCSDLNIPVVRRPTGGRAILHQFEITYSIISPYDLFPLPTTLTGIYKRLAHWQVESLTALGLRAALADRRSDESPYQKSESCFMTSTPYEVHVCGKKICGSAQKRGKSSFLQHGSILVDVDVALMQRLMGKGLFGPDTFTTLRREGYEGSVDSVIEIMEEKFPYFVESSLIETTLTDEEIKERDRLLNETYRNIDRRQGK